MMRFKRKPARLVLPLLLCAALRFAQVQEPSSSAAQAIRVSVDRVNVGVIVTDSRGQFVEGLQRANFHIFDNAAEQPIVEFAPIADPGQVLLLVESGPAVYLLEGAHLQAAFTLLNGLSADDRVAVVGYADSPRHILDFTADKRAAAAALDQLRFNLGFSQLNLSSSLSTALGWLAQVPGKKTIVLLSTGVDTSPQDVSDALLARLKTSDVRVLAVSLSGPLRAPKPARKSKTPPPASAFAAADQQLKSFAEATGGRAYFSQNAQEFRDAYAQIAQLIRHEYSLAFTPPSRDAALHSLDVRVTPNLPTPSTPPPTFRVDHRQAYIAPHAKN